MKGRPKKLQTWSPRITVTVPRALKARLDEYEMNHPGELNRSDIATKAFENFLKKEENGVSEPYLSGLEAVVARLDRIERILKRRSNLEAEA